jgi:diguanylate cyclase
MISREHEFTVRIAEEAIERIKALGLPADPIALTVWYTYVSGGNDQLNRRINSLIADKASISSAELDEIYDEFFSASRTSSAYASIGTKVSVEIDNVVGMLSELALATSQGRADFSDASRKLASPLDHDKVQAICEALGQSLRAIEVQYGAMEKRLIASRQEIADAQLALARASAEANTDFTTGLTNRRGFESALARAVDAAKSEKRPLSLLIIDIDHFKQFNDRFGHLIGDTVLRLVSVILKQSVKGQDIAARYGGEEFAVILPDTDLAGAVALAEQIRVKIEGRELKRRSSGEMLGAITVSIGVVTLQGAEGSRSLLERADINLYRAKTLGRNCTCADDDAVAESPPL